MIKPTKLNHKIGHLSYKTFGNHTKCEGEEYFFK